MSYSLPRILATFALSLFTAAGVSAAPPQADSDVLRVDEAYRLAKLQQDTRTLDRILAPGFNETNQNGNSRNKAQTLDLWKSFSITSLTTDKSEVRVTGDTAMVLGTQTENGNERMLFTRVYVNRGGSWQLLSSIQYRDPNSEGAEPDRASVRAPRTPENEVMQVDEAYRIAKLRQDTNALGQLLAEGFNETNQNGNSRNKVQTLELWKGFSISSLTTDTSEVRLHGDTAMVLGTQTENGYERMLFSRVYVKQGDTWRLLASMQYRNPNAVQGDPFRSRF